MILIFCGIFCFFFIVVAIWYPGGSNDSKGIKSRPRKDRLSPIAERKEAIHSLKVAQTKNPIGIPKYLAKQEAIKLQTVTSNPLKIVFDKDAIGLPSLKQDFFTSDKITPAFFEETLREKHDQFKNQDLFDLTPAQFEQHIYDHLLSSDLFISVRRVAGPKEHGADIVAETFDKIVIVIQAKHYKKSTLSIDAIKQTLWARESYKAHLSFICTTATTVPHDVLSEAKKLNIRIVTLTEIPRWLKSPLGQNEKAI